MKKFLLLILLLFCVGRASAQVPTLDQKCVATTGTNQTFCTMTGVAANDAIIVHLYFGTGQTLSSLQDCSGSSACSSSTDALTPSISCVTLLGVNVCEYYICASALSGTVSVTANYTGSLGTNYVEASAWKGMLSGGCLDQTGTGTTGSSNVTSLVVNTAGIVGYPGELVIGFIQVGAPPTTGSGFTQIQISGNLQSEYLTSPTAGVGTSASWTFASTTGRGLVSTWKGGIFTDSHSAAIACGNVSSCAWNHTVGTGPNPFLWVVFNIEHILGPNNPSITSVTAGGVGMNLAAVQDMGDVNNQTVYAYYLTASGGLPTGVISIQINLSGVMGGTNDLVGGSTSFFGVAQRNPFDNATVATFGSTNASPGVYSTSITTITSGTWIVDLWGDSGGNSSANTPNSPQVLSWKNTGSIRPIGVSYNGPIITPTSVTDAWTDTSQGTTNVWGLIVAALKPAGSIAAAGTQKGMMPMVI